MSAGNNCRNHPAIYSSSKIQNISAGLGGTIKAETHELKTERSSASGRPASSVCWCRLIFCLLQIYPGTAQLSSGSRQERQRGERRATTPPAPPPSHLPPSTTFTPPSTPPSTPGGGFSGARVYRLHAEEACQVVTVSI